MWVTFPAEVVLCVIFEWLPVISIGRLDSACCNTEIRTELLTHFATTEHLALHNATYNRSVSHKNINTCALYKWASIRQLKLSSVEVDEYTDPNILSAYLSIAGPFTKALIINKMDTITALAVRHTLANLQEVHLHCGMLTASVRDLLLVCAGTLRKLSVKFSDNVVSDYFVGIKCPQLTTVTSSLNNESTTAILSMSDRITHLSCAHSFNTNYNFLSLPCCACLLKLNLFCTSVSDQQLLTVCDSCTQIEAIDVRYCRSLTDVAIVALVTRCSHLRTLWMSSNDHYTDTSLHAIAVHAPYLKSFTVHYCRQLTTIALLSVLTACQSLHTYFLCNRARDSTFMLQIAQHLPSSLLDLNIFASMLPDAVLRTIAQRCPLLQHLDMRFCTALTQAQQQQGVAAVACGCPRLRTVVVRDEDASAMRAMWQALRPDVRVLTSKEQPWPEMFDFA